MTATLNIYDNYNCKVNTLVSNNEKAAIKMKLSLYEHYFRYKNNIGKYIDVKITALNDITQGIVTFANNIRYEYLIEE